MNNKQRYGNIKRLHYRKYIHKYKVRVTMLQWGDVKVGKTGCVLSFTPDKTVLPYYLIELNVPELEPLSVTVDMPE